MSGLLCASMLLGSVGCGSNQDPAEQPTPAAPQQQSSEDASNQQPDERGETSKRGESTSRANTGELKSGSQAARPKPPVRKPTPDAAPDVASEDAQDAANDERPIARNPNLSDDVAARKDPPPSELRTEQDKNEDGIDQLPWAIRLGIRVERVNRSFPVMDQVVLVPDVATLVDEVARWSVDGRWPVLIEDDVLTPMFIAGFEPARVIRRESVGALPGTRDERQRLIEQSIVRIWGGNEQTSSPEDVFASLDHEPAGVVVTSMDDSAWPAGFILAAGRGQPIGWLDDAFGRNINQTPGADVASALIGSVEKILNDAGYPYGSLGDTIETITICRNIAGRMQHPPRAGAEPVATAMTDLLGRHANNERYAFAGWIFGDEARSVYVAMCSLFLDRTDYWLANTYGTTGNWGRYAFDDLIDALHRRGFTTQHRSAGELSRDDWLRMLPGGVKADVVLMNSKGNADFFDVAGTGGRMRAGDVPILHTPAALQMIHSWSLRSPAQVNTIGAQWLERGVYAYVGSVAEPQLSAFIPSGPLSERLTRGVPLLIACRHWEGRMQVQTPWKVNTVGDPLMICRPPILIAERVAGTAADRGDVLDEQARVLLTQIRDAEAPAADLFVEAISTLDLLGRDEMVLDVWRLADAAGHDAAVSGAALPAMFRLRERDLFRRAYASIDRPTERQKTLLWHLMLPDLGSAPTAEDLSQFTRSLRRSSGPFDLERIAGRVKRVLGMRHLQQLVDQQLEQRWNEPTQRVLRGLLK